VLQKDIAIGFAMAIGFRNEASRTISDVWFGDRNLRFDLQLVCMSASVCLHQLTISPLALSHEAGTPT
jgi:hypothetical protein